MTQTLRTLYSPDQLLTNDQTDLRDYYDLIELGSYYTDNIILFIIKIPIMYEQEYSFYHLFPTPTINYTIIIPSKPYLAMNGKMYQYMSNNYKKFKDTCYCNKLNLMENPQHTDCIYSLILHQELLSTCQHTVTKLTAKIIEKMDDWHYITSFPKRTKITTHCDKKDHNFIQGTFLQEIPEGCTFASESNKITNRQNILKIKLLSFELSN